MSASAIAHNVGVKDISRRVTVPNNDVARLMYYMQCATVSCGLDIIQDDLVDYPNYSKLSQSRQDTVFVAAYQYSPDELLGKTIFLDEDGSICGGGLSNKFFEVSEGLQFLHVQSEVLIAGEKTSIRKIMVFKQSWINDYYLHPMQRNATRLKRALVASASNHCEHCAGRVGKCACEVCPRTSESQCSPTRALSGILDAFADLINQELEKEQEKKRLAEQDHCAHCNGLHALCGCSGSCPRPTTSRCYLHCEYCKGAEAKCGCGEGCQKPDKAKCLIVHSGVKCDACGRVNLIGNRYKCNICYDYDLCQTCYSGNRHEQSHEFVLLQREGGAGKLLLPRVPKAKTPPQKTPSPKKSPRGSQYPTKEVTRKGFFYENMTVSDMKSYLRENGVAFDGVYEREDLRRLVWNCHCDSMSGRELAACMEELSIDSSGCSDIPSRRACAKAAFREAKRPVQPSNPISHFSSNEFRCDQEVQLVGLKAAHMNGKKGTVVDPRAVEGRAEVLLDDDGTKVRVKYENLQILCDALD